MEEKNQKKQFWSDTIGFKFKMSNIQAAIGCGQIERVEEIVKKKIKILNIYKNALLEFPSISMNPKQKNIINGAWMPTVVFLKIPNYTRNNCRIFSKRKY